MRPGPGWLVLAALALAGCASGNSGREDAGPPDAGEGPDAAPMMRTFVQTTSDDILVGNSASCNGGSPLYIHKDNSYYRVFDLPALGVSGAFAVTGVTFGVDQALSGDGTTQPISVRLHRLSGQPALANLSQLASTTIELADTEGELHQVPITATVPAGAQLVVEVFSPDGNADGNTFFLGSNTDGETAPVYLAAPDCDVPDMTPWSTVLSGSGITMHAILEVSGSFNP
ncbi:MAG TPA: hypothetical protein VL172_19775 [Kofleriaceae bacterium]|nr:hypothetical protein [Kofleriaceae bacterium]